MKQWPIIPTLLVTLAVAAMVGLGFWQIVRKHEKEALLTLLAANQTKPAIAYPPLGPVDKANLFRRSSANCLKPVGWHVSAGKDDAGKPGQRYIVECATGAEGPGLIASVGVSNAPDLKPDWKGGILSGMIIEEPDRRSLLSRMIGKTSPLRPMLVVDHSPIAGLRAPAKPSPGQIPNNHMIYAIQWFFFATAAAVIYTLALRKRWKGELADPA